VSLGRKVQRHACSVIGTRQYRRMESSSASASLAKGSGCVEAAGKAEERETNASNLFKAPQAAEERETNAPCRRETAENRGTRETNVSEEETAVARRDGKPLTSAGQERRQGVLTAAEYLAAGESPNPTQEGATATDTPRTTSPNPGDGAKTGECRPGTADALRAGTPAGSASGGRSTSRSRCSRRQLTQLLKEGSECFDPDEVRRIVRAARAGPEGSLTAICTLDDDMALFMHAFPDADDRELRAQCLSTLLEYEESMQAWEEARNSGQLDSYSTDSEDEGELTGSELLRDLEEPATDALPGAASVARPNHIEWPKRVLRQTILVSSIAAEIESNIDWTDWDADCFEECRRLLQREARRMEATSEDRGAEEIPILVDLEVQHWIAEALEGTTRASELIGDRIALAGVCCLSRGEEESRTEASSLRSAAGRVTQAVMRAATTDPLSDSQLERVVRLALGKRAPAASTTSKAAVAHAAAATTSGGDPSRASAPAVELTDDHQAEWRVASEDESESRASDPTRPEGSPPAVSRVRLASPGPLGVTAQSSSEASVTQLTCTSPPTEATIAAQGRKKKNRAARRAARAAREAGSGSPTTGRGSGAGGQTPPVAGSPQGKKQCPVFGCARKHAPNDCPTFLDMTPKERLDLVHAKQLCLLCLRHPTSVGCEIAGKGSNCSAEGCDRPHHVTLHGILKAGKSSPPVRGTDPPDGSTAAAAGDRALDLVKQLRGLLEGLGIDPGALEVRIGIRRPGEQGRPHGGGAADPGETKAGEGKLTSGLLEALTLLCRAGVHEFCG
jgi:hypothetical protein